MAFCRNCGKPLLETDKFCSSCGTKTDISEHNSKENPVCHDLTDKEKKKKSVCGRVALALLAPAGILIIMSFFTTVYLSPFLWSVVFFTFMLASFVLSIVSLARGEEERNAIISIGLTLSLFCCYCIHVR